MTKTQKLFNGERVDFSKTLLKRFDNNKANLEPIIQNEVSQKEKHQYSILTHVYGKDGNDNPVCETAKETQMYRTVFWTLWERERVG